MATILIADDHTANRHFLVTLLGYRQHRLLEAADGQEALRLARAERPDLIISDILMPTMDGFEFVRQLRNDPAIGQTPVVFCTAHYLGREASTLAHACGVAFILYKPCTPETVLHTVDAALGCSAAPALPATGAEPDRAPLHPHTDQPADEAAASYPLHQKLAALLELS
jgi:CheY-like chemotaxis protein